MSLLATISAWSEFAFGFLLFAAQLTAHEVGFWFGRRAAARAEGPPSEGVGVVVGGMLGLLAFVLALTLSFATERFGERHAGTLAEANAIGTAWLRAKAIGQPRGDEIARLLERYTVLRKAFVEASHDPVHLAEVTDSTNALQSAIWGHLSAIVREQPNPISSSLMAALNDTFDASTAERFAFELRLPPQIFWLLIGLSLLGMAALGYQLGLRHTRLPLLAVILTLMWTLVIIDILDLATARIGNIRTSTAAYEWTLTGFQGSVTIPAAPSP